MKPILTVEFTGKAGDYEFKEESVPIHSPEELFEFIAPGGGCDSIPDEVEELRVLQLLDLSSRQLRVFCHVEFVDFLPSDLVGGCQRLGYLREAQAGHGTGRGGSREQFPPVQPLALSIFHLFSPLELSSRPFIHGLSTRMRILRHPCAVAHAVLSKVV